MLQFKLLLASAALLVGARKAAKVGAKRYPKQMTKMAAQLNRLRSSLQEYSDTDTTKPISVLSSIIKVVESQGPRAVPSSDGLVDFALPAIVLEELEARGYTHYLREAQRFRSKDRYRPNQANQTLAWSAMRVILDGGEAQYDAVKLFERFWLLTRKDRQEEVGVVIYYTYDLVDADASPWSEGRGLYGDFELLVVKQPPQGHEPVWRKQDPTRQEVWRIYQDAWHGLRREVVQELCWPSTDQHVLATYHTDMEAPCWSITFRPHQPHTYIGAEGQHKKLWTRMLRSQSAFNVMLYGAPGCGKTTLMREWFAEEGVHVVEVAARDLIEGLHGIEHFLSLQPDVLLIEDLDRVPSDNSTQLMALFEHSAQHESRLSGIKRPMIFTTCNHPDRLADAFYRPGRFDQIIEVCKPGEQYWDQVIDQLCLRFDLAPEPISPGQREEAYGIMRKLSVAHLEQYIGRIALFGEDAVVESGDRTFSPPITYKADH